MQIYGQSKYNNNVKVTIATLNQIFYQLLQCKYQQKQQINCKTDNFNRNEYFNGNAKGKYFVQFFFTYYGTVNNF